MKMKKKQFYIIALLTIIILLSAIYNVADRENEIISKSIRNRESGTYITLSKGVIHYELIGNENAQTVVLVHGGTIPMFDYNNQVPEFVTSGFRVLRYDQYGRGYSDRPSVEYNKKLYCDLLLELLDSLKIKEPVDMVGHSFGGSTVVHFASLYPHRVRKMVLFSPMINGIADMTAFKIVRFPLIGIYAARFLILPLSVKRIENFFDESPDTLEKYKGLFEEQMNYKGFEKSLFSMMKSNAMRDYSNEFNVVGNINKEVLIIWGNSDETISRTMIDMVRECMPKAQYVEIEGGTHAFNFKQFEKFNHLVMSFLKE